MKYYLKATKIREDKLGIDHIDTAKSYNNIGDLYKQLGNYDYSIKYY